MDKNTVLFVVIAAIILVVGMLVQPLIFPPDETAESFAQDQESPSQDANGDQALPLTITTVETADQENSQAPSQSLIYYDDPGFMRVALDPKGGAIRSIQLLEHQDGDSVLEVFFDNLENGGLTTNFGGVNGLPMDQYFYSSKSANGLEFEFYRDFVLPEVSDASFRITKRYIFSPGEYMFEMEIDIKNSVNDYIPLDFSGVAYTINLGPQIGPRFTELTAQDYRRHVAFVNGGRQDTAGLDVDELRALEERSEWAGIDSKYFSLIGIPVGNVDYQVIYGAANSPSGYAGNQIHFIRPEIQSGVQTDTFRIYAGPKQQDTLSLYESAETNGFGIRDLGLTNLGESSILGFLEDILKFFLGIFYQVVGNWGVAIIILTIFVKLLLFPLTRKSFQSTSKMQALAPKLNELKEKYADDKQKLNVATMDLYKKEGVSPLGGCLPMLIQFPFFIAMYGLFNNHFDLRGAVFIPGWINDLSAPESILEFGFTIPLLGWTDLRLLPILYLGTQIVSSRLMQTPQQSTGGGNTKLMMMLLPVVFFFILYNMPSGLLVYWMFQNIITSGQQFISNKLREKKAGA